MKLIRFPKGEAKELKAKVDPAHKLFLGPITYTCPHCSTVTEASFSKMVFRTIDFYCGECGTFGRIVNPAFTPPKPR